VTFQGPVAIVEKMLFEELGLFENFEELPSLAQLGDVQLSLKPGPRREVLEDALRGTGPGRDRREHPGQPGPAR
jgi:hypothetical protein